MRIRSVEITSFGKFRNKTIEFTDSLNIIAGNNESGKSTIISFIYAMFYGFGDNRGKGLSLREKYTPWDGGTCEGKLNLTLSDGKNITIYRKSGEVKKYDVLKVYNTDTAEKLNILPEDIIGVSSDTFSKTVFIKQLSTVIDSSSSEIVTRLANIAKSGDESADYEKAIKILENAKREIRPLRGSGGTLPQVIEKITSLERQKASQDEIKAQLEIAKASLSSLKNACMTAEEKYEDALKESFDADIANISGRIAEKEEYLLQRKKSYGKIYFCAGVIFIILAISLLIVKAVLSLVPFIAASALFSLQFIEKKNDTTPSEIKKLEDFKVELSKLEEKKKAHEKIISSLKQNAVFAREKLTSANMRISSLESQVESIDTSSLPELYKNRLKLEKSLSVLSLAADSLESSHKKMQKDFTPAINKKAAEYLSFLTDGKYNTLFCDDDFNLSISADIPREAAYFSGGTVDQIYLSLRLALTDMLFGNEDAFIILDQPFLQYDNPRTQKAIELFESMAKNRQILLFSSTTNEFSGNKNIEILT